MIISWEKCPWKYQHITYWYSLDKIVQFWYTMRHCKFNSVALYVKWDSSYSSGSSMWSWMFTNPWKVIHIAILENQIKSCRSHFVLSIVCRNQWQNSEICQGKGIFVRWFPVSFWPIMLRGGCQVRSTLTEILYSTEQNSKPPSQYYEFAHLRPLVNQSIDWRAILSGHTKLNESQCPMTELWQTRKYALYTNSNHDRLLTHK